MEQAPSASFQLLKAARRDAGHTTQQKRNFGIRPAEETKQEAAKAAKGVSNAGSLAGIEEMNGDEAKDFPPLKICFQYSISILCKTEESKNI